MKFTIEGYSQEWLTKLSLTSSDAILLRWFADFAIGGGMKHIEIEGTRYYWIDHKTVMRELPILGIRSTRSVSRVLDKLVKCTVLEKYTRIVKDGGSRCFYAFGDSYLSLCQSRPDNFVRSGDDKSVRSGDDKIVVPDSSISDSSTRIEKSAPPTQEYNGVKMSPEGFARLCKRWPKQTVLAYCETVRDYCYSHGKRYRDYEATVRNFIKRDKVPEIPHVENSCPVPECGATLVGGACVQCGYSPDHDIEDPENRSFYLSNLRRKGLLKRSVS